MSDMLEHELLFGDDFSGGPSLSTVETLGEADAYFASLAAYHDTQRVNIGLKEFVYADSEDVNMVLSGDTPTFALLKSGSGSVRISGGDNTLLISGSHSNIVIDGGVTRIFVDAEMESLVQLEIVSGEVVLDFLHSDLSTGDDLVSVGKEAWLTGFPARISVEFQPESYGSLDLSVLGVKKETLDSADETLYAGKEIDLPSAGGGENQVASLSDATETDWGVKEFLTSWSTTQDDLMLIAEADIGVAVDVSLDADIFLATEDLEINLLGLSGEGQNLIEDTPSVSIEDMLDSAINTVAFATVLDLVWSDAVDVLHEVTGL